jgi:hypothetical protein
MKTSLLLRLLLLPAVALLMAATPLVDPTPVITPDKLNAKEVHHSLRHTLMSRDWQIDKETASEYVATLHVRVHSLTIRFVESAGKITMSYVGSENLDYKTKPDGGRTIHRKYPEWMANLKQAIARDLDLLVIEKAG